MLVGAAVLAMNQASKCDMVIPKRGAYRISNQPHMVLSRTLALCPGGVWYEIGEDLAKVALFQNPMTIVHQPFPEGNKQLTRRGLST